MATDLIKSNLLLVSAALIVVFIIMYAQHQTILFFDGREASKKAHLKSNVDHSIKNDPYQGAFDNSHQNKLALSFDSEYEECDMCGESRALTSGLCQECIQDETYYSN